jgi:PAS domain S-box-containing protein
MQIGEFRAVLRPYIQVGTLGLVIFGLLGGWAGAQWPAVTAIVLILGPVNIAIGRYSLKHNAPPRAVMISAVVNGIATILILLLTGAAESPFWMLLLLGVITGALSMRGTVGKRVDQITLLVAALVLIVPTLIPVLDLSTLFLSAMKLSLMVVAAVVIREAGERLLVSHENLGRSEARFRQLTDHLQGVFYLTDLDSRRLLYVSPGYERIWGRSKGELNEDPDQFTRYVLDHDRGRLQQALDAQSRAEPSHLQYRIRRPDGSIRWISDQTFPVSDPGRPSRRVAGIAQDITEQKETARSLEASEQKYRMLVETAQDLIFIIGTDLKFQFANRVAAELFGLQPDHIVGQQLEALFADQVGTGQGTTVIEAIESGEMKYREHFLEFGDRLIWLGTRLVPIKNEAGQVLSLLGVSRDITAQREYAGTIQKLNEDLEGRVQARTEALAEKNQELEQFTYSVSHDLKAPLRGINGYMQILLDQHGPHLEPDAKQLLGYVRESAGQMENLINDLLTYSRLEQREVTMAPIQLKPVLESLLAERQNELTRLNFSVSIDLACQRVFVEREGFQMSIRNILDNAIKFSQVSKSPQLMISSYRAEDNCVLVVADNGQGFDMQFHDKIFQIFERLNLAEDYPGTGIGLALVKKAMNRIGGRVWAQSSPGEGATFYLELPSAKPTFRYPKGGKENLENDPQMPDYAAGSD